jgi:WH2 motif.
VQPKKDPIVDKLLLKLDAKNFQEAYKNLDTVLSRVQAKTIKDLDRFVRPLPSTPNKINAEVTVQKTTGSDRGKVLNEIEKGVKLKPVSQQPPDHSKSSNSLLDDIKKGKTLKPVSEKNSNDFSGKNKPRSQEDALKDAIDKRRKDLQEDESEDQPDTSGDWD